MKKRMLMLSVLVLALAVGCGAGPDTTVTEDNAVITETDEENEEEAVADFPEHTEDSGVTGESEETADVDVAEDIPVAEEEEDTDSSEAANNDAAAENPEETVVETPAVEEPTVEEPASGPQNYVAEYRVEEGYLAPDFSATLLDGSVVNLSDYQGAPVILNFWATWCGPCCSEMPAFQQLTNEYGAGLTILAVNCGESATAVQSFVSANGYTFPIALDTNYAINSLYPTNGIPYTIVIDEYGVIRHITVGASTADVMYNHYKECLQNL